MNNNFNNFNNFINSNNISLETRNVVSNKSNKSNKKKLNIKELHKKTCSSLVEIECFLNKFSCATKYLKLYNLFKK